MTGQQHLAIGIGIGTLCAVYKGASLEESFALIACGGLSALAADIDGKSIINRRVHQVASILRWICISVAGLGLLLQGILFYWNQFYNPLLFIVNGVLFSLLLIMSEGILRNGILSAIGIGMMLYGSYTEWIWLVGLGLFVAIGPWFKHRGFTHTVWSLLFWISTFYMLQLYTGIEGLSLVAGLGYFSHLLTDSLSFGNKKSRGVKWFYPLWNKELRL